VRHDGRKHSRRARRLAWSCAPLTKAPSLLARGSQTVRGGPVVTGTSPAPHRTNKPSLMGASAHRWRSRTAAGDLPYVPCQPLVQLASKHKATVISPRSQHGLPVQSRPPPHSPKRAVEPLLALQFLNTGLRLSNKSAFHALAIDEHRKAFAPTLWTVDFHKGAPLPHHNRTLSQVEQRWFVGAHANVGGGCQSDPLPQAPLNWMMDKATHVQDELGILPRVMQAQQASTSKAESNALQVRVELQADCLAGIWANRSDRTTCPDPVEAWRQAARAPASSECIGIKRPLPFFAA
jgi:Uncharacterized alpha/beta hydrolase domain (DUF2235)/Putative neutral zinc metallopeptidase